MSSFDNIMPLILAAGESEDFAAKGESPYPALARYCRKHLYEHVLDAIRGAGLRGGVMIAGWEPVPSDDIRIVRGGANMKDSLWRGLKATEGAEFLLIATADMPDLTSGAVKNFVELALQKKADVVYPVVPADTCASEYRGMDRTVVRLREGEVTGGNLFLIRRQALADNWETICGFLELRKNVLKLAWKLGPAVMFKFILGQLSLEELRIIASEILGVKADVIVCLFSDAVTIGADADNWEQFQLFEKINRRGLAKA